MTEAQWKAYADTLRGTWAQDWEGTVNDVTKGSLFSRYDVFIDAGRPSFGSDVFIGDVPEDVALALNKGARVRFSGTLDFVSDFLGFSVHLDGQTTTFTVIEQ